MNVLNVAASISLPAMVITRSTHFLSGSVHIQHGHPHPRPASSVAPGESLEDRFPRLRKRISSYELLLALSPGAGIRAERILWYQHLDSLKPCHPLSRQGALLFASSPAFLFLQLVSLAILSPSPHPTIPSCAKGSNSIRVKKLAGRITFLPRSQTLPCRFASDSNDQLPREARGTRTMAGACKSDCSYGGRSMASQALIPIYLILSPADPKGTTSNEIYQPPNAL